MSRRYAIATTVTLLVVSGAGPALGIHGGGSETVPCVDPRGCPDLVIRDSADHAELRPFLNNETFSEDDCAVQEGMVEPGERRLLRFNTTHANWGPGDLVVGSPQLHPRWYEESECHGHLHFENFSMYRLWTPDGFETWNRLRKDNPDMTAAEVLENNSDLRSEVVTTRKQGFCLQDNEIFLSNLTAGDIPKYRGCDSQGITAGHGDEYASGLAGQWIDVTDVPNGTYVLENEANAGRIIEEARYANNRAWTEITIGPGTPNGTFLCDGIKINAAGRGFVVCT